MKEKFKYDAVLLRFFFFFSSCSFQIDSRKEQLDLAKKELKQAKKEAKGSSDNKLLMSVSYSRPLKRGFCLLLQPLESFIHYMNMIYTHVKSYNVCVQCGGEEEESCAEV